MSVLSRGCLLPHIVTPEILKFTRNIRNCVMKSVSKRVLLNRRSSVRWQSSASLIPRNSGNMLIANRSHKPPLVTLVSVVNADEDKANVFGDYFAGVYTHEPDGEFNALPSRCPTSPCKNVTFSEDVILDKLNNLKVNKSPGPVSLHPRVLSELRYQPLCLIFETSYNTGCIPSD